MENLKYNSLLLVNSKYNDYFRNYFRKVYLAKDNQEVLDIYYKKSPSVIFFNCHEKKISGLDVIKYIRKSDKETILALIADTIEKEELIEILGLHLMGCLIEPLFKDKVQELLQKIDNELIPISKDIIPFKNGSSFNRQTKNFFNTDNQKIILTKSEILLIEILLKHREQWVNNETIGYYIWENDFFEKNCTGRLKTLINSLRKKIPKKTIVNSYGMGYKVEVIHSLFYKTI